MGMSKYWLSWVGSSAVVLTLGVACGGSPEVTDPGPGVGGGIPATGGRDGGGRGGTTGIEVDAGTEPDGGEPEPDPGCEPGDPTCDPDAPACGDALVNQMDEACDDGNNLPGDGCSGVCESEPNFECPSSGGECVSTIECGNGIVEGGEVCDTGVDNLGEGCSEDCLSVDPDFDCSVAGEPCTNLVVCGDGFVTGTEACDDGGAPGGCLRDCSAVEPGYICLRPGKPCVVEPSCGDGVLNPGEQCDDGNTVARDGCKPVECTIESGFACMEAGKACAALVCGDGIRTPDEQCDDHNRVNTDGCSTTCRVQTGWVCPIEDAPCVPRCGDGVLTGYETCDDRNRASADGCNAACQREPGWACTGAGAGSCTRSVCGNGTKEGDEGCDDRNLIAGDGCGPTCQNEPTFAPDGSANLVCGDGLIIGSEECDDGGNVNGDGCSSACRLEPGFACERLVDYPASVRLAVTYRDFKARAEEGGHPDFQWESNPFRLGMPGPACTTQNSAACTQTPCQANTCGRLDSDGKPVLRDTPASGRVTSAGTFGLWYRDTNPTALRGQNGPIEIDSVEDSLLLSRVGAATSDVYSFDSGTHFPLNGRGFGTTCSDVVNPSCCSGVCAGRNYHFTSELRYFFQYQGGETLTFRGDDDVWVFVNGRLAVDIGGVHGAKWGRVVLGDDGNGTVPEDSNCSAHGPDAEPGPCSLTAAELSNTQDTRFGLTRGGVYQIVLFHAERHTTASNFRLTLAGFLAPRTSCSPICGNGILQRGEVCDDGAANANNVYGACNKTCSGRQFCGDGTVNGPEICDNGLNVDPYGTSLTTKPSACAPGCVRPGLCGDATLQPGFESCDLGAANNTGGYEGCTISCGLGPYCGDGTLQSSAGETCDKGNANGGYGKECSYECQPAPYCGDGVRNGPEQCDLGEAGNTGEYGTCNPNCTAAPRCGDGVRQSQLGEECDDGVNGGGYGKCGPSCKVGPHCGDGVVQRDFEICDDGDNTGEYGKCAPGCKPGPRCGDGRVQRSAGEECDDPSSSQCTSTCRNQAVPR